MLDQILVTASENVKPQDRSLGRNRLQPLQLIRDGRPHSLRFTSWGTHGISSIADLNGRGRLLLSTGDDLVLLATDQRPKRLDFSDCAHDVHEMEVDGDSVLIANTGKDEILEVDCASLRLTARHPVGLMNARDSSDAKGENFPDGRAIDRFHANQCLPLPNGRRAIVVHHVTGKQLVNVVASRILKQHGNGGLLFMGEREPAELRLKAPHSLAVHGQSSFICDSGRAELVRLDNHFAEASRIELPGWGRGSAWVEPGRLLAVGISAIRPRYAQRDHRQPSRNEVVLVDVDDEEIIARCEVPNVEQINNVYCATDSQIDTLEAAAEFTWPRG